MATSFALYASERRDVGLQLKVVKVGQFWGNAEHQR
jgi:hypothetical protein